MPLLKKAAVPVAYDSHRALTAAAQVVNIKDSRQVDLLAKRKPGSGWQADAWQYRNAIGELHYAFDLFANILSRIRLHAAWVEDESDTPTALSSSGAPDEAKEAAATAMRRVFGHGRQAEILRLAALNLQVAGEFWLVQVPADPATGEPESFMVVSDAQLTVKPQGKGYSVKTKSDQGKADELQIPPGHFCGRIWRRDPQFGDDADSSMRGVLEPCDELLLLGQTSKAAARSRLNAGLLFVPDTLSVTREVATDSDPTVDLSDYVEDEEDNLEEELLDTMTTPISDPESAAAVVPILVRGPAEAGAAIRFIKFERSFDPQLNQRAERLLERVLQGIDLPKDIVSGMANLKYSAAVQVQESLYTSHIEPLVLMLCDSFRTVWLAPALKKAGVAQDVIDKIVVWYDPSGIMTAPDRSNAANVGFNNNAISWAAWREANGFNDDDAPSEMEVAQRLALSRGQINDKIMEQLLATLIPEVLQATRQAALAESAAPLPGNVQELLDGRESPPDAPGGDPSPPAAAPPQEPTGPQSPPASPPPAGGAPSGPPPGAVS